MCCFAGYICSQDTSSILLKSLRRLENLKHNFFGISVLNEHNFQCLMKAGKVSYLELVIDYSVINGFL